MAGRRIWRSLALLAAAVAGLVAVPAGTASAAQHQNAYQHVYWSWPGGRLSAGQNIDQFVRVTVKARFSYWALQFALGGPTQAGLGYLGLQTDGNRADGSVGDTARFSIWGADNYRGKCAWNTESQGYSCAIAFPIDRNAFYRYRMWKLEGDANGQWWGVWIKNNLTGVETRIGDLHTLATNNRITNVVNFSEYFGTAVACDRVPLSVVWFTPPHADLVGAEVWRYDATFNQSFRGSCTGGNVVPVNLGWATATQVRLGDQP